MAFFWNVLGYQTKIFCPFSIFVYGQRGIFHSKEFQYCCTSSGRHMGNTPFCPLGAFADRLFFKYLYCNRNKLCRCLRRLFSSLCHIETITYYLNTGYWKRNESVFPRAIKTMGQWPFQSAAGQATRSIGSRQLAVPAEIQSYRWYVLAVHPDRYYRPGTFVSTSVGDRFYRLPFHSLPLKRQSSTWIPGLRNEESFFIFKKPVISLEFRFITLWLY